jgi:hypothetical protein
MSAKHFQESNDDIISGLRRHAAATITSSQITRKPSPIDQKFYIGTWKFLASDVKRDCYGIFLGKNILSTSVVELRC